MTGRGILSTKPGKLRVDLLGFGKVTVILIDKIDDAWNRLIRNKVKTFILQIKRPKPTLLLSDEVKSALEMAISEKDTGRYREALQIVDEVLKGDPHIPMAVLIKAMILWEGFNDSYTAMLGFKRVKQLVPNKNDRINRMASEFIEEIEHTRDVNDR